MTEFHCIVGLIIVKSAILWVLLYFVTVISITVFFNIVISELSSRCLDLQFSHVAVDCSRRP